MKETLILFISGIFLLFIIPCSLYGDNCSDEDQYNYIVTASTLTIRLKPSLAAPKSGSLKKGDVIQGCNTWIYQYIDNKVSSWIKVFPEKGAGGYAFGGYLKNDSGTIAEYPPCGTHARFALENGTIQQPEGNAEYSIMSIYFKSKYNAYVMDVTCGGENCDSFHIERNTGSAAWLWNNEHTWSPDKKRFYITSVDDGAGFNPNGIQIISLQKGIFKEELSLDCVPIIFAQGGETSDSWYPEKARWVSNKEIHITARDKNQVWQVSAKLVNNRWSFFLR